MSTEQSSWQQWTIPKTFGRARTSFADPAEIDEFVTKLEAFESGELGRISGARSACCAAPTGSVSRTCR